MYNRDSFFIDLVMSFEDQGDEPEEAIQKALRVMELIEGEANGQ